ncbi:hypothetical protein FISHEDRAFT_76757 [Fistulina hepatica ATCC 64428]|uniref:SprT-like domain-containing protein n=1 Tax=Fistulina hepatica ATCC 64428 TaxID=1128425 RepID=A0A0D7A3D1_9AGAR|nr:hypothetical protein FISHEDRAFT_76757 [Fistulina hepatica ATCC 64428]
MNRTSRDDVPGFKPHERSLKGLTRQTGRLSLVFQPSPDEEAYTEEIVVDSEPERERERELQRKKRKKKQSMNHVDTIEISTDSDTDDDRMSALPAPRNLTRQLRQMTSEREVERLVIDIKSSESDASGDSDDDEEFFSPVSSAADLPKPKGKGKGREEPLAEKHLQDDSEEGFINDGQDGDIVPGSVVTPARSVAEGVGAFPRGETSRLGTPSSTPRGSKIKNSSGTATPKSISAAKRGRTRAKKPTAKELKKQEEDRLLDYATSLFQELNEQVFGNRLPRDTNIVWYNRLRSTAGRARYERSGGITTSMIQLSEKILQNEIDLKNTLSHEMCHLALWVVDEIRDSGHGEEWLKWKAHVENARPDIQISIKHSYKINFTYQWMCEICGDTYGRWSDSLDVEKDLCATCFSVGRKSALTPLFQKRRRNKKKPAIGASMASAKPQNSPVRLPLRAHTRSSSSEGDDVFCMDTGDEVLDLTTSMQNIVI